MIPFSQVRAEMSIKNDGTEIENEIKSVGFIRRFFIAYPMPNGRTISVCLMADGKDLL